MMTTTELPGLLRGCIQWRDDRPWADNDALIVVADWCEDNDRPDDAEAIREAMSWPDENAFFGPDHIWYDQNGYHGEAEHFKLRFGSVMVQQMSAGEAVGLSRLRNDIVGRYETCRDEDARCTRIRPFSDPTVLRYDEGALERIRDLARWDLICHMLRYPPLRLVGEE